MNFNKEKSTANCEEYKKLYPIPKLERQIGVHKYDDEWLNRLTYEEYNKLYPIPKLERKKCIYNEPPKLERQIGVHKYDDEWFKTIFRQSKL
jgi:hypothetical protein